MKVNVEIECTPEEARQMMGLPDLGPVQDRYVARLADLAGGIKPDALQGLIQQWGPMGEAGLGLWRALVDAAAKKDGAA